jgi:hypothetical protein
MVVCLLSLSVNFSAERWGGVLVILHGVCPLSMTEDTQDRNGFSELYNNYCPIVNV